MTASEIGPVFARAVRGAARLLGLGALLILSACDEPTIISHVGTRGNIDQRSMVFMQGAHGIAVEMHGLPFRDIPPDELAEAMRGPTGPAHNVRFHAVSPGMAGAGSDHDRRIVLHFNPAGGIPNAVKDCRRTKPAETDGPGLDGFSVNVSFCAGPEWRAHGYVRVLKIADGDLDAFSRVMQQAFRTILPKDA